MLARLGLTLVIAGMLVAPVSAETFNVDLGHSSVQFKVRHLGISKVVGNFNDFSGVIQYDPEKPAETTAEATIQVATIDTNDEKRDGHLKSADFFDVENHPTITFKSSKVSDVTDEGFKLHGDLTMRGVTKPVVLMVETFGVMTDPWGNTRTAFSAKTSIDRKEFGINWNKALDNGGLVVGNKVEIMLELEGIAAKPTES